MQLVDQLRRSFSDVWIGLLAQESIVWLTKGFPQPDKVFVYGKTPGECRHEILDHLPDYLIDLSGSSKFWLFKNRLRVTDFKLPYKRMRRIDQGASPELRLQLFHEEMQGLLSVFDLKEPERQKWTSTEGASFLTKVLPESYHKGYMLLFLDGLELSSDRKKTLVTFLTMLDFPTVLLGKEEARKLGDSLTNQVGCTVFNVAGDFSEEQQQMILSGSLFLIGSNTYHQAWAFLLARNFINLNESWADDGSLLIEAYRIRKQLMNTGD